MKITERKEEDYPLSHAEKKTCDVVPPQRNDYEEASPFFTRGHHSG